MTLFDYLKKNDISYHSFGYKIGIGKSSVYKWANKCTQNLTLENALKIVIETKGQVDLKTLCPNRYKNIMKALRLSKGALK